MSAADKRKYRDRVRRLACLHWASPSPFGCSFDSIIPPSQQISQARSDLLLVRRNFEAAKAKAEKALLLSGGRGPSGKVRRGAGACWVGTHV